MFCLLLACMPVQAEDRDSHVLSEQSYTIISNAQKLMDNENYVEAERNVRSLITSDEKAYDKAVAQQTLAHIQLATGNYTEAIKSFSAALESNQLPGNVQHQIHYLLTRLYVQESDYDSGVQHLEKWLAAEPAPDKDACVLAASVYYQLGNFEKMISMTRQAIRLSKEPEQALQELLVAGYIQTGDFLQAAEILEQLIISHPNTDNYWLQLATCYQLAGKIQKSIAVYEIALARGMPGENHLLQLINLYLNENLPYKAARLLEKQIQSGVISKTEMNLQTLVNAWLLAREYTMAITVLTELANISSDPSVYFRIGQLYFEQGKWNEVVSALDRVIKTSNPVNIAESLLLQGIAAYHLNNTALSTRALNEAASHKSTRDQALWWLDKITTDLKQAASG